MKNSEQPAFPLSKETTGLINCGMHIYTGLTKREHFACIAMQALISELKYEGQERIIAQGAVRIADELLKRLEK